MIKAMTKLAYLKISLNILARIQAQKFSVQQSNPQKKQQVYYNTLAVSAVNNYIQSIGWQTKLETSDSWNPIMQTLLDTADLELPGYGKLECRYVQSETSVMRIPEEVNTDRLAYVAVAIERSHRIAYLLGFVPEATKSTVALKSLQPMAEFPEYLEKFALGEHTSKVELSLPQLTNWVSGAIEAGWQTIESFRHTQPNIINQIAPAGIQFRTGKISRATWRKKQETLIAGVSRVKLWDLGREHNCRIALIICLFATNNGILDISIKVCPTDNQIHLPEKLTIKILDEAQQPLLQAQTKSDNQNIEFFLSGEAGEFFSIQAILNGVMQMESFII